MPHICMHPQATKEEENKTTSKLDIVQLTTLTLAPGTHCSINLRSII